MDGPQPRAVRYPALGAFLAARRAARLLTQPELAARVGISPGYLAQVEGGSRRPSPEVLQRLAGALSVDVTEVAGRAGYAAAPQPADDPETEAFRALSPSLKRLLLRIAAVLEDATDLP
jgi:transcriptional regulator with XRE-family HTH domain